MITTRIPALGLIVVLALLSMAFVKPLPLLFSKMEQKVSGWNSIKVYGMRNIQNGEQTAREEFELALARPAKMTLTRIDSLTGERRVMPAIPEHLKRFLQVMLLASNKAALFDRLNEWQVSPEPVGLGRLDRTICQIVGALESQDDRAQFWVDAFDFFPLRLLLPRGLDNKRLDIRMLNWDAPATHGLFPQKIEFRVDNRTQESWEVSGLDKL